MFPEASLTRLYAEPQYGGGKTGILFTRPIFSCYDLLVTRTSRIRAYRRLFDREGHILAVSEPFEVMRSTPYRDYSMVTYNVSDSKGHDRPGWEMTKKTAGETAATGLSLAIITLVLLAVAAVITMIVSSCSL